MKKTCKTILLAFCLAAFLTPQAFTQSSKSEQIENFLKPFIAANQFGGQIVATENGKIVYQRAFGLANADFKIPNDRGSGSHRSQNR